MIHVSIKKHYEMKIKISYFVSNASFPSVCPSCFFDKVFVTKRISAKGVCVKKYRNHPHKRIAIVIMGSINCVTL